MYKYKKTLIQRIQRWLRRLWKKPISLSTAPAAWNENLFLWKKQSCDMTKPIRSFLGHLKSPRQSRLASDKTTISNCHSSTTKFFTSKTITRQPLDTRCSIKRWKNGTLILDTSSTKEPISSNDGRRMPLKGWQEEQLYSHPEDPEKQSSSHSRSWKRCSRTTINKQQDQDQ